MTHEVKLTIAPLWKRYLRLPRVAYKTWQNNKGRGIIHNWNIFLITAKCICKNYK